MGQSGWVGILLGLEMGGREVERRRKRRYVKRDVLFNLVEDMIWMKSVFVEG